MTQVSEKQTRLFGKLLQRVLIEIRGLGSQGRAQQAADLADAFHNLPVYMFSESFSWSILRLFVTEYQQKYSLPKECGPCDYLTILEGMEQGYDDVKMF